MKNYPRNLLSWLRRHSFWLVPTAALFLLTPFTPRLDLAISRYFYQGDLTADTFSAHPFFLGLYNYGVLPGFFLLGCAIFALLLSFLFPHCRPWRPASLAIILTITLGSGIIVNALLKEHWGRPRPRQLVEFGGAFSFHAPWEPSLAQREPLECCRSFPCGHCSMGFAFFSLYFLGRRYHRPFLAWSGLFLALCLGGVLGLARIAQGGHFFSDVLYAGLVMWLTALWADWLVHLKRHTSPSKP